MQQPEHESINRFSRTTISGRNLKYELSVAQEPKKARACGAGPRSSADRRPVDPPPVVELKVYDGEDDITMSYNAGFMLYASLEASRPIANGRMHNGPMMPVLTGVAVASAAYLERPRRSAYFIFPDLSVRHEGWYRLKFSLFEATKDPGDADISRPFLEDLNPESRMPVDHEAMANRLEVVSRPFQVFSAKKFPGLNESTELSRIVAEQGCRVRIRRDIRQRKRAKEPQASEAADDNHSTHGNSSTRGTPKPEQARPSSRNSNVTVYPSDRYRRESMESRCSQRPAMSSRHPSIGSIPMSSPTVPGLQQMMPMPPPSYHSAPPARPAMDLTPLPSPLAQILRQSESRSYHAYMPPYPAALPYSMTPEAKQNVTLPPLHTSMGYEAVKYDPSKRQYDLPESTSTKRAHSPQSYHLNAAMKSGARPDTSGLQSISHLAAAASSDFIEPDDTHDSNDERDPILLGPLAYRRANGSYADKSSDMRQYQQRW